MTDKERIDDAYERIDIDTDEILAFYEGERVERCLKSIWDSTVTMHQIATVALKENAKLRELVRMQDECIAGNCECCKYRKNLGSLDVECELDDLARELGIEVEYPK